MSSWESGATIGQIICARKIWYYCPCRHAVLISNGDPLPSPLSRYPYRNALHVAHHPVVYTLGSGAPEPCPQGTASSSFQLVSADDCPDCTPGFYCPESGTYNATLKCTEGFYCPGRDTVPTEYELGFPELLSFGSKAKRTAISSKLLLSARACMDILKRKSSANIFPVIPDKIC